MLSNLGLGSQRHSSVDCRAYYGPWTLHLVRVHITSMGMLTSMNMSLSLIHRSLVSTSLIWASTWYMALTQALQGHCRCGGMTVMTSSSFLFHIPCTTEACLSISTCLILCFCVLEEWSILSHCIPTNHGNYPCIGLQECKRSKPCVGF